MESRTQEHSGSLVVVGTGISASGQITLVTKSHIQQADTVFAAVLSKPTLEYIKSLNKNTISLSSLYQEGKDRRDIYSEMVAKIVEQVKLGVNVCAVFYGHPGVFVDPSHKALTELKRQGYQVLMEPGVSAADCLYADLGIDPASYGCNNIEATQYLVRQYALCSNTTQIIWQVGSLGQYTCEVHNKNNKAFELFKLKLLSTYDSEHIVTIYEAKTSFLVDKNIKYCSLGELKFSDFSPISTLVIPSTGLPDIDHCVYQVLKDDLDKQTID